MSVDQEVREQVAMRQVTDRLVSAYRDAYSVDAVRRTVEATHHRFDGRPIREFVPVLVERLARQELSTPTRRR